MKMSLRRLTLKANRETGHVHVHDLVTGAELGLPLRKVELEKCLDELSQKQDGPVGIAIGREKMESILDVSGEYDGALGLLLGGWFLDHPEVDPQSLEGQSMALREVTKTARGMAAYNETEDAEAALHDFREEVASKHELSELELAVNRYMTDNSLDYPMALKEFTATPRGAKLWADYMQRGGE
jgi:hypothetical protein